MTLGYAVLAALVIAPVGFYFSPRAVKRWVLSKLMLGGGNPGPPKSYKESVLPHGELQPVSDNLWVVSGTLPQPGPKFNRNMVVYKIPGSDELLLHSVVCLNEKTKAEVEQLGRVKFIIVPNSMHRLDANAYQAEYPDASFLCPKAALEKMKGWVNITGCVEDAFPPSKENSTGVKVVQASGCRGGEFDELQYFFRVGQEGNLAFVCTDLFFNLNPATADPVTKFIGSANGFGLTSIGKIFAEDLVSMKEWVQKNLVNERIEFIIVGHGDLICGKAIVQRKVEEALKNMD